jgi:hypothetical protein
MSTAGYSLLGVVLGALLSGGFVYWNSRLTRRRLRIGALRLIDLDLERVERAAALSAERGTWSGSTLSWIDPFGSNGKTRLLIASELSTLDWWIFRSGQAASETLELRRSSRRLETGEQEPTLSSEDRQEVDRAVATIQKIRGRIAILSQTTASPIRARLQWWRSPVPPRG